MPVVEESIVITRPPAAVYDYLGTAGNVPQWDSSVVEAEQIGAEPLARGTRWRGASKILGRRFEWTTEVTDAERPVRIASRSVEGKLTFTVLYDLQPHDGGTLLRYRVEAESGLGGVFGRFGDPLVQTAQGRTVRTNLQRLAGLLAARHAA